MMKIKILCGCWNGCLKSSLFHFSRLLMVKSLMCVLLRELCYQPLEVGHPMWLSSSPPFDMTQCTATQKIFLQGDNIVKSVSRPGPTLKLQNNIFDCQSNQVKFTYWILKSFDNFYLPVICALKILHRFWGPKSELIFKYSKFSTS